VLRNLYAYLVDQNYLMGNPWSGVRGPQDRDQPLDAGRSLSPAQWQFVAGQLEQLPDTSAHRRLRLAVKLLYASGLRLSEVVAVRLEDLRWVEYPPDAEDDAVVAGWLLQVTGKGRKRREVPLPQAVVDELSAYLVSRGLDPDPRAPAQRQAFLLARATDLAERAPQLRPHLEALPGEGGVAATTLYRQIKGFFRDCARVLSTQGDVRGAERLARASTHWLRHSHASHAIARGLPIEIAQQNLGHASLATTTVYVATEAKRRMKALQRVLGNTP
jgi:site-specific recombinase XerD